MSYMCSENHRVVNCPTFSSCPIDAESCMQKATVSVFFCLNRGHAARDCKSKERGGTNGCTHFHHHLLHNESSAKPPTTHITSATSALDKNSTMPVVRVLFKSANGKTREGNVLVDSGAGTIVIPKTFARALSIQGRKERTI